MPERRVFYRCVWGPASAYKDRQKVPSFLRDGEAAEFLRRVLGERGGRSPRVDLLPAVPDVLSIRDAYLDLEHSLLATRRDRRVAARAADAPTVARTTVRNKFVDL